MELSRIALTKIGNDGPLYTALKAAQPDERFTATDQIMIVFQTPTLREPGGPNREEEAKANGKKIREASEAGKKALEAIEGLKVDQFFGSIGSAMVSGPAQAIATMLELPEINRAISTKGVTFVPASRRAK